jgi:type IV secretion system protein VirB1
MDGPTLLALLLTCAPQVDVATARFLIEVESSSNPHAIGVVSGALHRQPKSHAEALATARALHAGGSNFSVGLAQINASNFRRLGLTVTTALDPCTNLRAMQTILSECYERATRGRPTGPPAGSQRALRQALSCYYSGDFVTGMDHGYVRRVARAAARAPKTQPSSLEKP